MECSLEKPLELDREVAGLIVCSSDIQQKKSTSGMFLGQ